MRHRVRGIRLLLHLWLQDSHFKETDDVKVLTVDLLTVSLIRRMEIVCGTEFPAETQTADQE